MAIRDRIRKIKHLQNKNFICVLENPEDIVNIASAIRNISAFGVEKLYIVGKNEIIQDFQTSRDNKKLSVLSVGANKWVYVNQFKTTQECINHLKKENYTIAVTSSHTQEIDNVYLYEKKFTHKKLAVWFGNESKGISSEAIAGADMCIQIPMGGIVESLNLGTSTGIVLSYISYQRLRYVFDHKKVRFKPRKLAEEKMQSWEKFIDPQRD